MTPEAFIDLITRLAPGAQARTVLDSVRFCIGDKVFATLHWPERGWAVVKLSPADQKKALARSDGFTRELGRRRSGVTLIRLAAVDELVLADVLTAAWRAAYGKVSPRTRVTEELRTLAKAS